MSILDNLNSKLAMLNDAERVEYNGRLQFAKEIKEFASNLSREIEELDRLLERLTPLSNTVRTIFLSLFLLIFFVSVNTDGRLIWLGSIVVFGVCMLFSKWRVR